MIVNKVDIVAVAVKKEQYPPADMAEIAFAGRSNVGKSSLLNLVTGRRKLAKVSGAPGKTRTINFYEINGSFRIVDLPGYGYAKISRSEREKWGRMIESYLEKRPNLVKVVQLVDIRHGPTALDIQMYDYLKFYGLDGFVVATKADKVPVTRRAGHLSAIRKGLDMAGDDTLIAVSALKKEGLDEMLKAIEGAVDAV